MKQEQAQQYIKEIMQQPGFEGDSKLEKQLHTNLTNLFDMQQKHSKKIDEMRREILESEKHLISINGQIETIADLLVGCEDERRAIKPAKIEPTPEELDALKDKE